MTHFRKAVDLDPQLEEAWCNRGIALMKKGEYEKALPDFQQALQLDPKDEIACWQRFLATSNIKLKKLEPPPEPPRRGKEQTRQQPDAPPSRHPFDPDRTDEG